MDIYAEIEKLIIDNNLGLITPADLRAALKLLADRAGIEEWQPSEKYVEQQMMYSGMTIVVAIDNHTSSDVPPGYDATTGLPNALISDINSGHVIMLGGGGAGGGVLLPTDRSILQSYEWVPGQSVNTPVWKDTREQAATVDTQADLSDRSKLPLGHLTPGKLVYVKDEQLLYELIADPTTMGNTIDDWRPMVSGVTYVGRVGNLPLDAVHGQMFVIRMDVSGNDYYRMVSWDESIPAAARWEPLSSLGTTFFPASLTTPIVAPNDFTITFDLPVWRPTGAGRHLRIPPVVGRRRNPGYTVDCG